jgi:cytochrome c-type biogenesis protein CcmF
MAGTTLGFLGLWGYRAFQARGATPAADSRKGLMRESFYLIGMATLLVMGVATMIGMSVPLVQAMKGQKPKVVEEALYHQVLPWIFVPMMLLMAVTPFVGWNGSTAKKVWSKVYTVFCITVGITGLLLFLTVITPYGKQIELAPMVTMLGKFQVKGLGWLMTLVGLCVFVTVAHVWRMTDIFKRSKLGSAAFFAHVGVAVLMEGPVLCDG